MLRFINATDALPTVLLNELVDRMHIALRAGAREEAIVPERSMIYRDDGRAAYFAMPALSDSSGIFITKVATFKARPVGDTLPSIHSTVLAFCARTGRHLAALDGAVVTNVKCAAVSSLVTQACTPSRPHILALLGAGVQARQQVWAVASARQLDEIRIWSRTPERAREFAAGIASDFNLRMPVRVMPSIDAAIDGATILSTTTSSASPLHSFDGLRDDIHINCMGAHTPLSRELPMTLLGAASLIVEDRATAVAEAGEMHARALQIEQLDGVAGLDKRQTVFSSTGHAFYDMVTTAYLLERLGIQ
ncbi:ornithine cyclodeaminase family protein [Rhizobacter sp. P5_C2]